jgi:hypothetical protein
MNRLMTGTMITVYMAVGVLLQAQTSFKFQSGQNVAPIFEGWSRKPNGGYTMAFGYLNRNYEEHVIVPVGSANNFEPGGPDRGQPGYFYPRLNHFVFTVDVPADWGTKELVWTLQANGKTEKAVGSLNPVWEINRQTEVMNSRRSGDSDEMVERNMPPTVSSKVVGQVSAGMVRLEAHVTDDGLPPPRPPKRTDIGQETPPTLKESSPSPVNVPTSPNPPTPPAGKLSVRWIVFRGPARVDFSPDGFVNVVNGLATASARFNQPGAYVVRALASDGMLVTADDVKIDVPAVALRNQQGATR